MYVMQWCCAIFYLCCFTFYLSSVNCWRPISARPQPNTQLVASSASPHVVFHPRQQDASRRRSPCPTRRDYWFRVTHEGGCGGGVITAVAVARHSPVGSSLYALTYRPQGLAYQMLHLHYIHIFYYAVQFKDSGNFE